jgi:hypothetical protein
MDAFDAAMRRARELRERATRVDRRTCELVDQTDALLEEIDRHTGRARTGRAQQQPVDAYPAEPEQSEGVRAADGAGTQSSSAGSSR